MASPFRRTLPARADLAQQKTLAKELLRVFAGGDPEATARVRAALPDKARIVLADAQFVLAREYGFHDWGRSSDTSRIASRQLVRRTNRCTTPCSVATRRPSGVS
ncbi:MAG: hypothetical protein IPK33_04550 [Gemmatimonadetes bacterium]|nr:hypothetical protein [Gemmatimonadota bacterium]